MERVATVCTDCPNRINGKGGSKAPKPGKPSSLVGFHDDGAITYRKSPGAGCGADIVRAQGEPAERLSKSIERCKGPDITPPETTVIKRVVGCVRSLRAVEPAVDCPAALAHFDDRSPTQVREFFEGA